jgi:hypothetical protein
MDVTSPGAVGTGLKRESDAAADTRVSTSSGLGDNPDKGTMGRSPLDVSLDPMAVWGGTSGMMAMFEASAEMGWRLGSTASRD